MVWPVRTTTDIITTDSAGRTVEAVPVYSTDAAVQNAAGQWVDPAPAEESDVGDPIRFVDAMAAQDSTGRWVDATPVSGVGVWLDTAFWIDSRPWAAPGGSGWDDDADWDDTGDWEDVPFLPIASGETLSTAQAKIVAFVEVYLGDGAASGWTTWGNARSAVNSISSIMGLATFADGALNSAARTRINALIDFANITDVGVLVSRFTTPESAGIQGAYSGLIYDYKAAVIWPKKDTIHALAARDSQVGSQNIKANAFNLTVGGGTPIWTAYQGVKGNATDIYLLTGFNPATAGGQFAKDSAHISVWVRQKSSGSGRSEIGNVTARLFTRGGLDGAVSSRLNDGTLTTTTGAGNSLGMYTVSRLASGSYALYWNDQFIGTVAVASTSIAAGVIEFLRSSVTSYSDAEISFATIGGGLNATEVAAKYRAERRFLEFVGAF